MLSHDGGDRAAFQILHIEGKRAVCGFRGCRQRVRPCAACRICQADGVAGGCGDDKVGVDPVVGVDAVFAAVGDIFDDVGRDAGGLHQRIVAEHDRVAEQSEGREADRNSLADRNRIEGRVAVQKL